MNTVPTSQPRAVEIPFPKAKASVVFPGRSTLTVNEVANHFRISGRHVTDLIEEGRLGGINVAGNARKKKRNHWRVPVSAFDEFVASNNSL